MDSQIPRYSIICFEIYEEGLSLVVMCNGSRFCVNTHAQDLATDPETTVNPLEKRFSYFLENIDEDDTLQEAVENWAMEPCYGFLRDLAPTHVDPKLYTLERYYNPPTFNLRLFNAGGELRAERHTESGWLTDPIASHIRPSELTLRRASLDGINRVQSSDLFIVPDADPYGYDFCAIPKAVRRNGFPQNLFFKAAFDAASLSRELEIYLHFKRQTCGNATRIPTFVALVEWNDGELMGFLTEYIAHTFDLRDAAEDATHEARMKWMEQIEATVRELHCVGLVWGDVKPENVLVDAEGDARVLDFGGGFSPDWVDEALEDTVDGDLQGVARLRDFLKV